MHGNDLDIKSGEFVVLIGPSGCGKSTTLRMIAGREDISGGEIASGGRVVNDLPPRDCNISMVFRNYALYPHMRLTDRIVLMQDGHIVQVGTPLDLLTEALNVKDCAVSCAKGLEYIP